ncbi:hypothetical protein BGZ58_005352 [Dissophora ornata]|nr:hypothetical protein BGZ58_005352 [Dissophora ornata]
MEEPNPKSIDEIVDIVVGKGKAEEQVEQDEDELEDEIPLPKSWDAATMMEGLELAMYWQNRGRKMDEQALDRHDTETLHLMKGLAVEVRNSAKLPPTYHDVTTTAPTVFQAQ